MAADVDVGIGLALPFALDDGRLRLNTGVDDIAQSIEVILRTVPGERILRSNFGAALDRFLFEPNIPATHRLIEETVTRSLLVWEPRIDLESVTVDPVSPSTIELEDAAHSVLVTITYRLRATGEQQTTGLAIELGGAT